MSPRRKECCGAPYGGHHAIGCVKIRPKGYNADNRTDYVQSDGSTQVMASVLAAREQLVRLSGRARLEAAHRLRAGMIGVLQSCLCDYPLTTHAGPSGHHPTCPSSSLFESQQRVSAKRGG